MTAPAPRPPADLDDEERAYACGSCGASVGPTAATCGGMRGGARMTTPTQWRVRHGDCLDVLRGLRAACVDSLVTDPPAGIGFMGKDWDHHKGGRGEWVAWLTEVMREALRVMKPGAHGFVWSLPRTSHWTATALEDAGFEVRDCVTHLFGTGFPKSLDVSKAIDKAAGAEREVIGRRTDRAAAPVHDLRGGNFNSEHGKGPLDISAITAPATDAAKQWQGWGTALKPAAEFWWLIRKPLAEKTVAANVLRHGTGGINIDGCRIAGVKPQTVQGGRSIKGNSYNGNADAEARHVLSDASQGRFPANLVLSCCGSDPHDDGCAVGALDKQSGERHSGGGAKVKMGGCFGNGSDNPNHANSLCFDSGGASRFFYVAKASRSDRGEGNTHPTVKSTALMRYLVRLVTPPGGIVLDPFAGSGSTGVAALAEGMSFLGVEREEAYAAIARARMEAAG